MGKSWNILTDKELDELAEVIQQVELKTSGEVRLLIVHSSAVMGHVFPLLWAMFSATFFLLAYLMHLNEVGLTSVAPWSQIFAPAWMGIYGLALSFFLSAVLARFDFVKRLMTSTEDMNQQALARAEVEFHREGVAKTRAKTGILLMLSVLEHQAVVLADRGIATHVSQSTWDGVIELILKGAKSGQLSAQMKEALLLCGKLLAEHFPREVTDRNELSNAVMVKE